MTQRIAHVVLWSNGMVATFDPAGEQILRYQGRLDEVLPGIIRDAGIGVRFSRGVWDAVNGHVYTPSTIAELEAIAEGKESD